jgi:ABC-2 type transport system permease protein
VLPTLLYVYTISRLSAGGIDLGGIAGSYIGLLLLAATFAAVGTYCSAQTPNALAAFLMSAFACFTLFSAFGSLSTLASLPAGVGYYVELLGIEAHYRSVSRGVVDSRDLVYFLSLTFLFLFLTARKLSRP